MERETIKENERGWSEGVCSDVEEIRSDKTISPKNQFSVLGYNTRNFLRDLSSQHFITTTGSKYSHIDKTQYMNIYIKLWFFSWFWLWFFHYFRLELIRSVNSTVFLTQWHDIKVHFHWQNFVYPSLWK